MEGTGFIATQRYGADPMRYGFPHDVLPTTPPVVITSSTATRIYRGRDIPYSAQL
jgi:hypothetical protein